MLPILPSSLAMVSATNPSARRTNHWNQVRSLGYANVGYLLESKTLIELDVLAICELRGTGRYGSRRRDVYRSDHPVILESTSRIVQGESWARALGRREECCIITPRIIIVEGRMRRYGRRFPMIAIEFLSGFMCVACSDNGHGDLDASPPTDGDTTTADAEPDADGPDHNDGSTPSDTDVDGDEPILRSPVQPYRENSFYWEYNGEPVVLIGGTWQDNPFQWADGHDDDILTEQLDLLESVGGNYLRNVINCRQRAFPELSDEGMASPFNEADGLFDLSDYNEDFFQRLRTFLEMTEERGFVIETELWDGPLAYHLWDHPRNPWRPSQNVNYDESEVIISDGAAYNFYDGVPALQTIPFCWAIRRTSSTGLDVTLDFDHVVYTLENESDEDPAFSDHWADLHPRAGRARGKTVSRDRSSSNLRR